jgi:nitrate/TMAO reductase-like tetraheme cytochrome c subunit
MMKARWLKGIVVVGCVLGVSFFLLQNSRVARSADEENHCFSCHTNPRKLIEITREITKSQKGKPGASAETKGEG